MNTLTPTQQQIIELLDNLPEDIFSKLASFISYLCYKTGEMKAEIPHSDLLYDLFLGFLLLSVWLNFINGQIPSLFRDLSKQTQLSLYSLIIICIPSLFSITFNKSGNRSTTFVTSIFSAAITLMVRELFVWWKERLDIRDEIFSELYGNYRALESLVDFYLSFQSQSTVVITNTHSSFDIKQRWKDQVFNSHSGKLQSKKIYSQEIIDEIRGIYGEMSMAIALIDSNDPQWDMDYVVKIFLNGKSQGTLLLIRNLLIHLDESKAYQFLPILQREST